MPRVKGYASWRPQAEARVIVGQAQEVLDEYAKYGPMTVRQVFYRLVGNYGFEKTEPAYKRLCDYLIRARRARMIRFNAIRDDGGTTAPGDGGFQSVEGFLDDLAAWGTSYRIDPTLGQDHHIEVFCEAEGMVPMLSQIVGSYGVPVTGMGGFSSLTATYWLAARIRKRKQPTVLLHIGDFDPSGVSIFESLSEDVRAFLFLKEKFIPRRLALTAEQVGEFDLPTAPAKRSDPRTPSWEGETTQAEALPPDVLAEIVTAGVEEWWDFEAAESVASVEEHERTLLGSRIGDAIEIIREELAE